jgi:hypothetical protein
MNRRFVPSVIALLLLTYPALATNRPFTLVEDDYPLGKDLAELENTFGYAGHTREEGRSKVLSAEHELEYGLFENFELKIAGSYFYQDSQERAGMHFDEFKVEGELHITNPSTDDLGIAIIASAAVGENTVAFEQFLILQKDWTKWTVAYNLGFVTEVEGAFDSNKDNATTGTIVNALGVDYNVTTDLRVGIEGIAESTYNDWSRYGGTTVYVGPVVNYIFTRNLWITAGIDALLTNQADEPRWMASVIVGWTF